MTELMAYVCTLCGSKSTTCHDLLAHYKNSHEKLCQICRSFPNDRGQHILVEHQRIPCELCYDHFRKTENYRSHYDINHSVDCLICSQPFNSIGSKNAHCELVHQIKCELCDEKFNTEQRKQKHHQAKHMKQCNLCSESFKYKNNLILHHQRRHQMQCHECGKHFDTEALLKKHLEVVHPRRRFECLLCLESFESELMKRSHYTSAHKFDCKIYQKILLSEDKMPIKAHKIQCHVCPSDFECTADLIEHYNQVHAVVISQPDGARDDRIKKGIGGEL